MIQSFREIYLGYYDPILYNILLNSDYKTLINQVKLNKYVSKICQLEEFWKEKVNYLSTLEICQLFFYNNSFNVSLQNNYFKDVFITNIYDILLYLVNDFNKKDLLIKIADPSLNNLIESTIKDIINNALKEGDYNLPNKLRLKEYTPDRFSSRAGQIDTIVLMLSCPEMPVKCKFQG